MALFEFLCLKFIQKKGLLFTFICCFSVAMLFNEATYASPVCRNYFASYRFFEAVDRAFKQSVYIEKDGVADVDPRIFKNNIKVLTDFSEKLSDKELILLIDKTLREDHDTKGYLAGLTTKLSDIRTLSDLVLDLSITETYQQYLSRMSGAVRAELEKHGDVHSQSQYSRRHWKNFLGNIFSQGFYHILIDPYSVSRETVYFDSAEITNHLAIYILHREAFHRLQTKPDVFLKALNVQPVDHIAFNHELKEIQKLFR